MTEFDRIRNLIIEYEEEDKYTDEELINEITKVCFARDSKKKKGYRKQIPRTAKIIEDMEKLFRKMYYSYDLEKTEENLSDYEQMIWNEPCMAIASTLYREADSWAIKIAEYIIIAADLENKKIKPDVAWT